MKILKLFLMLFLALMSQSCVEKQFETIFHFIQYIEVGFFDFVNLSKEGRFYFFIVFMSGDID